MHSGTLVFTQLMEFFSRHDFDKSVRRYRGNYRTRDFSCRDQFLAMAFAQLTYRESLRDIETCLRSVQPKLYHMGFRGRIARSTLADANRNRDWRIYADLRRHSSGARENFIATSRSESTWTGRSMLWIRQPSTCVSRCFPGPRFDAGREPSNFTRCSICAAISPVFLFRTEKCTT